MAEVMTVEQRTRLIEAAQRGLAWREEKIMRWRVVLFAIRTAFGHADNWHAYFNCERHGQNITAKWVGPYDLGLDLDDPEWAV